MCGEYSILARHLDVLTEVRVYRVSQCNRCWTKRWRGRSECLGQPSGYGIPREVETGG
jgi:hypothetical protein